MFNRVSIWREDESLYEALIAEGTEIHLEVYKIHRLNKNHELKHHFCSKSQTLKLLFFQGFWRGRNWSSSLFAGKPHDHQHQCHHSPHHHHNHPYHNHGLLHLNHHNLLGKRE